jgi:predicted DNA-binding transcriptional regulator AlpA
MAGSPPKPAPILLRTKDVAHILSVSESQVVIWSRSGVLKPIRIPGIRAVRYLRSDVEALAKSWIERSKD